MESEPTVYVIDEDASTQGAVRDTAETLNVRCDTYVSGLDLLDAVGASVVGCLVAELKMQGISGTQLLTRLAAKGALLPVIFVTNETDVSTAVKVMRAGAFHLLQRPFREQELWDTVQEAIQLSKQWAQAACRQREIEDRVERLTAKERELLQVVAQNKPTKAIAAEMGVCARTIEVRRSKLMRKFEIESLPEFFRFAAAAASNGNGNGHSDTQGGVWRRPVQPR
jgi:two-component system response regulator FixJ